MSFKMNERTNGNELHCVLSLGFKDSRHEGRDVFCSPMGKRTRHLCACVCLSLQKEEDSALRRRRRFQRRRRRQRGGYVVGDSFSRWTPFWLKVFVVFFVCLLRRLSMLEGLRFGRGISPPPPPNVCAFVVTACLCRRRRDDTEEQTRRTTTTTHADSRSDALV